ncbi:MAG TPA: hypothetical protein VGS19_12420 [Streptosporangiaceae bacterium]|nr:hypothetical protein [Streptosporangiaceae bacterium]
MGSPLNKAVNDFDEESFQALYGRWDPLDPDRTAALFATSPLRWWIVGGRAARVGAPARHHEDTDVAVRMDDLHQWVFKKDSRVRLPWERALHTVNGIQYLRPEVALLHKAYLDRPKDTEDLAAARLDPDAQAWLVDALEQLGRHKWADLARRGSDQSG